MRKIFASLFLCLFVFHGSLVAQTLEQFQVLVYTSPDRWHDRTIPVAMTQLQDLADRHTFGLTWAQASGSGGIRDVFTEEYLSQVDVIVFLHSRGADLSESQMENFKKFIRNGGGFVGIHAVSANRNQQEEWFQQLVGRIFTLHPEEQTAVLHVLDRSHPSTMHLPEKWVWTDEWYAFGEPLTNNLKDLLKVDESTYDPNRTWGDDRETAMGSYHPIAWYQEFDGGRSFYTSMGHLPATYRDPNFLAHIYGGIYWAATGQGVVR
jgi:type 1 glutamine amidotransferase